MLTLNYLPRNPATGQAAVFKGLNEPVENCFINCGWGTGGFKAIPGSGWAMAELMAKGHSPLAEEFSLTRFREGRFIDESVAAGVAH
ncbi:hypothetical protein KUV65_02535 [Maritalea mobilis]|uniref:hypothetical protein n=1 Tax=Maritalea mobilis TaxID=483324 RepID=UPI001C982947|nr:hypothetical protein [Maritalea mobilis]